MADLRNFLYCYGEKKQYVSLSGGDFAQMLSNMLEMICFEEISAITASE